MRTLTQRLIAACAASIAAATVVIALPSAGAHGQDSVASKWTKFSATGPAARFSHTAWWDTSRDTMFVFAGQMREGAGFHMAHDVWEFSPGDGSTGGWRPMTVTEPGPSSRASAAVAFDSKRNLAWIYGGSDTKFAAIDEMWAFEAPTKPGVPATWTKIEPAGPKPPARFDGTLVYDPKGDQLILHGGCTAKNQMDSILNDMWFFDLAKRTWSTKPSTAEKRWMQASAFDPEDGVLFVHGGFGSKPGARADGWRYDVKTDKWTQLPKGPAKERVYHGHRMLWDTQAQRLVFHGGSRGDDAPWPDDLWSFDPKGLPKPRWSSLNGGSGPGPRAHHSIVWAPPTKSIYLFGGVENQIEDAMCSAEVWVLRLYE